MSGPGPAAPGAAALIAALALARPAAASPRRVDVGGFRLEIHCAGRGGPSVVLDAGAGDTMAIWDSVFRRVKSFTRVCAYDRAGLGKSDAGPAPRTSGRIAGELWELLERARVPAPYVLVGHSFGGMNVRVLAARHPGSIAGLVLVDATPVAFPSRVADLRTPIDLEKLRTALGMAPPAARQEIDDMTRSAEDVRAAGRAPDVPVVVVTSACRDDSEAFRSAWLEMQHDLAASFPGAEQIIAAQSGHYVQLDQPELVVDAIREVVDAARRNHDAVRSPD